MKLTHRIGHHQVSVHCADDLRAQAEALLAKLAQLDAKGPPLGSGSVVDFGWSRLTLEAWEGDELVVREPNFLGDPKTETTSTVNTTLGIVLLQAQMLQRLGAEGLDTRWDATLTAQRGAIAKPRVYLERKSSDDARCSGWYLGGVEDTGPVGIEDLEALPVYRLYMERPELLDVLALPTGWLVVFAGQGIEAALDPTGKNRWEGPR